MPLRARRPREGLGNRYSYDMLGEAARTARRRALFRRLRAGDRCRGPRRRRGRADRRGPGSRSSSRRCIRATRWRRLGARVAELLPRIESVAERAAGGGDPGHDRRRGVRPAGAVARALRAPRAPSRARRLGRARPRGPGVPEARDPRLRLARALARDPRRRIMVRLVKGAYWDTEIKLAQVLGLDDYPVFTRKQATDVSYIACAQALLAGGDLIFPVRDPQPRRSVASRVRRQRASSSSRSCTAWATRCTTRWCAQTGIACRVYAPVGGHRDLLPISCAGCSRTAPTARSCTRSATRIRRSRPGGGSDGGAATPTQAPSQMPKPALLARSPQLARRRSVRSRGAHGPTLSERIDRSDARPRTAWSPDARAITEPADRAIVGSVAGRAERGRSTRSCARPGRPGRRWDARRRRSVRMPLRRAADLYEATAAELIAGACARPARPCPTRSPRCARRRISALLCHGGAGGGSPRDCRGRPARAIVCSPAAASSSRSALELPARDLHRPGDRGPDGRQRGGRQAGGADAAHRRQAVALSRGRRPEMPRSSPGARRRWRRLVPIRASPGWCSPARTQTARAINRALAAKDGSIVPLIAETGGLNAMVVDSSALPEQVVADTLESAFQRGRSALLGAARPVRAGRHRAAHPRDARRRDAGTADRRSGAAGDRRRPGDR